MQQYAEEAVKEHLGKFLQPAFFKEKKNSKRAPFSRDLSDEDIEKIMIRAMLNSDRGKILKNSGMSTKQIYKEFKKPVQMKVFSWRGEIDTTHVAPRFDPLLQAFSPFRFYGHGSRNR